MKQFLYTRHCCKPVTWIILTSIGIFAILIHTRGNRGMESSLSIQGPTFRHRNQETNTGSLTADSADFPTGCHAFPETSSVSCKRPSTQDGPQPGPSPPPFPSQPQISPEPDHHALVLPFDIQYICILLYTFELLLAIPHLQCKRTRQACQRTLTWIGEAGSG